MHEPRVGDRFICICMIYNRFKVVNGSLREDPIGPRRANLLDTYFYLLVPSIDVVTHLTIISDHLEWKNRCRNKPLQQGQARSGTCTSGREPCMSTQSLRSL
jgi:hypothetical protein